MSGEVERKAGKSAAGQALVSRRKQQEFAHELLRFVRKELL